MAHRSREPVAGRESASPRSTWAPKTLRIRNVEPALPTVRYPELGQVLARRTPRLGEVLKRLPPLTFESRSELRENHPRTRGPWPRSCRVPELSLRTSSHGISAPHQVLIADGIVLPDSYRHYTNRAPGNRYLTRVTPRFVRYPPDTLREVARQPGEYLYLGSEVPRAFGHLLTEQVSRLWAWPLAKERYPHLKALVSIYEDAAGLQVFERDLFTAAGISESDLVPVKGPVQVDTLLAATPMFVWPGYIHPGIAATWKMIAEALLRAAPQRQWPAKIFVSRRPSHHRRACLNSEEVEQAFVAHGFSVVYPEDYPLAEQASLFVAAEAIAGYTGSGLFSLIFCSAPKPVILISSEAYIARNEFMIASVLGHPVTMVWCDAEVTPSNDRRGFSAAFSFNFARDRAFLDEVLAAL